MSVPSLTTNFVRLPPGNISFSPPQHARYMRSTMNNASDKRDVVIIERRLLYDVRKSRLMTVIIGLMVPTAVNPQLSLPPENAVAWLQA